MVLVKIVETTGNSGPHIIRIKRPKIVPKEKD